MRRWRLAALATSLSVAACQDARSAVVVVPRAAAVDERDANAIRGLSYSPQEFALGWLGDSLVIGHLESYVAGDVTGNTCGGSGLFVVPFSGGGGARELVGGDPVCRAITPETRIAPDLRSLVYSATVPTNMSRLFRFDLRERRVETLFSSCSPYAEEPALSRDGTRIAFKGLCEGRTQEHWGIYVGASTSSEWRRVTPDSLSAELPSWSPDDSALVVRLGDATAPAQRRVLALIPLSGSGPHALHLGLYPSWSPDGKWIAHIRRDTAAREDSELRIIDPESQIIRRVFLNQTRTTYVRGFGPIREGSIRPPLLWTRDSRGIVFGRAFDRGVTLWHVSIADGAVRQVTEAAQR